MSILGQELVDSPLMALQKTISVPVSAKTERINKGESQSLEKKGI